ncbi:MAG: glycosyltransferase, partial [Planctomycetota bacterium]
MDDSGLDFSVVIPSFNRPARLEACIDALCAMDYLAERYEIVVVDDGSPMRLDDAVARGAQGRVKARCIRQENQGPGGARNRGAREARGKWLAFIDDDCKPHKRWLSELAEGLREAPTAMVGGDVVNDLRADRCAEASQQVMRFIYEYFNATPGDAQFFCSDNMAMSRELFAEVGGFRVNPACGFGEDRELCDRWRHRGYPRIFRPGALIYHYHAMTLRKFVKQHFGYGRGGREYQLARAEDGRGPVPQEPLSFYFGLVGYPFRDERTDLNPLIQSALIFLCQGV